jgi:DNA-binding CsgD family transcriptional regulator
MAGSLAPPMMGVPVPSLVCHGRSPDADLTYRHLVRNGPATVGAIAGDLGMDRRRVLTALDELATIRAARARPAPQGTATWTATPPAEVLDSLRRPRGRTVPHDANPALNRYQLPGIPTTEPLALGDDLHYLPSRSATRARLAELVAVASHEHLAMHPEAVFEPESLRAAAPMDRELLARGVRMRVLGVQPDQADHRVHRRSTVRPTYRLARQLPVKLLVIDRKVALFPVAPENLERGYLEVAQAPVVAALVALFERHWDQAAEPQECTMPQIVLTPRERVLITLLAQGHTDATAARELRVSPRSVSNMLRSLMDRLEVDNRFQLGLALGSAHAIPTPALPVPSNEE